MKNAICFLLFVCITCWLDAQNVGIGIAAPSEKLHVSGNLRFDGALMPNNLPGSTGDVLTSQGAGVAPVWAAPSSGSSTQIFTVAQSGVTAPNPFTNATNTFVAIPGLTYNLVLTSPRTVMIVTDGSISSSNWGSIVDIGIFVNGASATAGGLQRVVAANYGQSLVFDISQLSEHWSLHIVEALPAGSHTIDVRARSGWVNARNYDSTVGSASALAYSPGQATTAEAVTRKQGVMHIIVF